MDPFQFMGFAGQRGPMRPMGGGFMPVNLPPGALGGGQQLQGGQPPQLHPLLAMLMAQHGGQLSGPGQRFLQSRGIKGWR